MRCWSLVEPQGRRRAGQFAEPRGEGGSGPARGPCRSQLNRLTMDGNTEWAPLIAQWVTSLQSARVADGTLKCRATSIRRLARDLAPRLPNEVTTAALESWLANPGWAPETAHSHRSAVRGFYRFALARGLVATDPAAALPPIRRVPTIMQPCPESAIRDALANAGPAVRVMILLAAELGLRRAEIAGLGRGSLAVIGDQRMLMVKGKGGKSRRVPVSDIHAEIIAWFEKCQTEAVFPGPNGCVSAGWVGRQVAAALPGAWTCHSLRRRFATVAYAAEPDCLTLQMLLGHSSPTTTLRYVTLPAENAISMVGAAKVTVAT